MDLLWLASPANLVLEDSPFPTVSVTTSEAGVKGLASLGVALGLKQPITGQFLLSLEISSLGASS